jgi:hypothetical protein
MLSVILMETTAGAYGPILRISEVTALSLVQLSAVGFGFCIFCLAFFPTEYAQKGSSIFE